MHSCDPFIKFHKKTPYDKSVIVFSSSETIFINHGWVLIKVHINKKINGFHLGLGDTNKGVLCLSTPLIGKHPLASWRNKGQHPSALNLIKPMDHDILISSHQSSLRYEDPQSPNLKSYNLLLKTTNKIVLLCEDLFAHILMLAKQVWIMWSCLLLCYSLDHHVLFSIILWIIIKSQLTRN